MLIAEHGIIANEAQPANGSAGGGLPAGSANGQLLWYKLASGLWVPSSAAPSASGQVPTWNGSDYAFENPRTYLFGASGLGNTVSQRWLNPGVANSAPVAAVASGDIVCGRSGTITTYTFKFRNVVAAQACVVSLWLNDVQVASFTIAAGVQSAQGAWSGGPFAISRGDVVAVGTLTTVGDVTASYPGVSIG